MNRHERLLMIVDQLNPVSPTGESLSVALALQEAGFDIKVLPVCDEIDEIEYLIPVVRNQLRLRPGLDTVREVKKRIREFRPDRVICWGQTSIRAGSLATLGCPVRLSAVHTSTHAIVNKFMGWHERYALSRFDQHFFRNEFLIDKVTSRFPGWQVQILPWSKPEPCIRDQEFDLRRELGLPQDAKIIGTCARLSPESRVKDFIWAGDLMKCIRQDVYWLVVGCGELEWRLRRFARHLEIGTNLKFLGWHPFADRVVSELDVYVQPSAAEDSCNGLAQAMTQGIPVVATSDSLHRSFVAHGKNGFVVERGARNEIARCINRLIKEPDIATRFAEKSQQAATVLLRSPREIAGHLVDRNPPAQTKRLAS